MNIRLDSTNPTIAPPNSGSWLFTVTRPLFVVEGLLSLLALFCAMYLCREMTLFVDTRPGVILQDPILSIVGPYNLRWPIFLVLWSSLVLGMLSLTITPARLLLFLQAAAIVILFRTVTLFLTPLEPFPTIIPLADPVATFKSDDGMLITKDLFFSGHTATLFLLFLSASSPRLKGIFLFGTVFTGAGVLLQHVHYSLDVFCAPFFAYGGWRFVAFANILVKKTFIPNCNQP